MCIRDSLNYTYDANSNLTGFTLNNGDIQEQSITYEYDDVNRLTNMTANGKIFSYTYDAVSYTHLQLMMLDSELLEMCKKMMKEW